MHAHFDEAGVASGVFARGSEGLVHGVAFERAFARFDFGEPIEVGAQATAAHGAFFGDAVLALGEDVGFAFLREKFDAHAGPRLLPVALGEGGFEGGEFAFGRADEAADGRGALAHLPEGFFGRDSAVHDPDAPGFAVLIFDFREEVFEGRFVGGVAGEDFVGERKTLGRDDEGDDDLHAVAAPVATIAKASDVGGIGGRIAFKIRAGEIVKEHLVFRIEEVAPARGEMVEERRFMRHDLVVAFVKAMDLRERKILPEQVRDGRVIKPMPMQPPLAARIDEPVKARASAAPDPSACLRDLAAIVPAKTHPSRAAPTARNPASKRPTGEGAAAPFAKGARA